MKYYLVARTTCCMVGIEECRGFIVGRSLRAAFEREYAGRILMVTSGALAWPGISYVAYKKASGPFYMPFHAIRTAEHWLSNQHINVSIPSSRSHQSKRSWFRQIREIHINPLISDKSPHQ